jgi:spermidine/putrescine transport system permease protein
MVFLAFTSTNGVDFEGFYFTLENFQKLSDTIYLKAFTNSILLSTIATVICLLIGYPVAYLLATSNIKNKKLILILMILPMWSNMLLRIIAWEKLFYPNSILNMFGISLNLIGTPIAVVIGMVSMYLPFMIFPIFSVLEKMDYSLIDASRDLGASKYRTFLKVTWPLSFSGVMSGVLMVFLPSATSFALPQRLGAGKIMLIGNIIENMFKKVYNYNFGSLLSMILILFMLFFMFRSDHDKEAL